MEDDYYEENLSEGSCSFDSYKITPQYHIQKAETALKHLKLVVREPGWKKVLQHKSGVVVYSKPGVTNEDKLPVFMGEHVIEGFTSQAIFTVIGMRKLWDDWYEEGNLVENLDDTTSLTYMVMQAVSGSQARDVSLVEKIECTQDGTIYFVATSVETPRVPRVANKIRAQIKLNGWILESLSVEPPRTKAIYVLQTRINGWVPSIVSKTYLSRRPLVLHTIDQYLQKNGIPPMVLSTTPESTTSDSASYQDDIVQSNNNLEVMEVKSPRKKISFTSLKKTDLSTTEQNDVVSAPPIQTNGKIRDDILPNQDDSNTPKSPSTRTAKSPSRRARRNSKVRDDILPNQDDSDMPKIPLSSTRTGKSPSRARSNPKIRDDILPNQDDSNMPKSPSSSTRTGKSPSRARSNPKIRDDILPNQDDSDMPKSSLSSTRIVQSPSRTRSPAKPIQHRHTETVRNALGIFKSHIPLDGWNLYFENDNIKVYTKEYVGKSTPILRGDATIFGEFTTYDILSTIKNLDTRKLWDDRYDEGATYEIFSLHEQLVRTAMKGTFPISGRDMSICGTLDHDEDTGTLHFVSTSVTDSLIPESKKHVRAHLEFAGWQLKPNFDSDGKTTSVDITYIVDVDIKLDTIPSSIRKTLSSQVPMIVTKMNEIMQKMGFPPYILNSTTKIIREEFNVKNNRYDLSLIAESGGVTELKLSKLMYPNGVEVSTIPENCKVELLPNSSAETIRVTLPLRVDLDTLTITINKHSKGFQMTYNDGQIIPIVSNSEKNLKPKHEKVQRDIVKQSKHLNLTINVAKSANATPVENGTTNKRKSKTPTTKSIIMSETFFKPSEVSLKSEPYQRMLEKQTLLENKIAAVTRASRVFQTPETEELVKKPNKVIEDNEITLNNIHNKDIVQTDEDMVQNDEDIVQNDEDIVQSNEDIAQNDEDLAQKDEDLAQKDEDLVQNDEDLVQNDDEDLLQNDEDLVQNDEDLAQNDEDLVQNDEDLAQNDEDLVQNHVQNHKDIVQSDEDLVQNDEDLVQNDEDLVQNHKDLVQNDEDLAQNHKDIVQNDEDLAQNHKDIVKDIVQDHVQNHKDIVQNDEDIAQNHKDIVQNDEDIVQNDEDLVQNDEDLVQNDEDIVQNHKVIAQNHKDIVQNHKNIVQNDEDIAQNNKDIVQNNKYIIQNNKYIARNNKDIAQNDKDIARNNKDIARNDKNIKGNEDIVVITDSIRFNTHQVGLMFAAMLLAYYAGKLSVEK